MPKLKIKNWKGLYTNIDENDSALDISRTSINFRYNRGYVQFENRELGEYALPDIDTAFAGYDWEWETGLYTTITNDPFDEDGTATKYNCLILVAKTEDSGTYHRLVYLKDLTNDSIWYELSLNGNANPFIQIENHDGAGGFADSYFSTTINAKAYFREESGHAKLFLPHMAFWIGRLERKVAIPGSSVIDYNTTYPDSGKWYIDKLVDSFNPSASLVSDDYPPYPHRLFWKGGISTSTDDVVRNQDISLNAGEILYDMPIDDGADKTWMHRYTGRIIDGGAPLPTTVAPYAPSIANDFINSIFAYQAYYYYPNHIVFPYEFFNYYEAFDPVSGAARDIVAEGNATDSPDMNIMGVGLIQRTLYNRRSLRMDKTFFETTSWRYKGTLTTSTGGFESAIKKFHLIVTAVLDEREEIIIKATTRTVDEAAPWKIVFTRAGLTNKGNARVTRLRYYLKLEGEEIYYLYKDIGFLTDVDEGTFNTTNFDIVKGDDTAVTLSANIGIEPDEKRWYTYTIIEGFRDFVTESGVSIGISNDDYSNIYYSVLGGGNLQPDLMYKQNILQVAGANVINAVAVINKELAALTDDTTYIIKVIESIGALVFTINTALEFGVKDQFDTAQMQGGLAINTRHGIYTTTGMQSNLISDAIDDIVKANFSSSRIYYNKDLHELYYKISNTDDLYRFRFKDNVWELISKI